MANLKFGNHPAAKQLFTRTALMAIAVALHTALCLGTNGEER